MANSNPMKSSLSTKKCLCALMLDIPKERLVMHLMGCPEDWHTKEYEAMPWWKKLLTGNPAKIYKIHMQQTGIYDF